MKINDVDTSDIVKYTIHVELSVFGTQSAQDTEIYIGKYKGEYRILNTTSMDTIF